MQIIQELKEIKNLSLALGSFDGIHLGHRRVIKEAVNFAKSNNLKSAIVTFQKHPSSYFTNIEPKYILSSENRYEILENLGIDYVITLDFQKIKDLSGLEYLQNILIKYFSPQCITTGFNHHFGANRSGNTELLEQYQQKFNYKYIKIEEQKIKNETVSSTNIRKYLGLGKIKEANQMLGSAFAISGNVVKGRQQGRTIGFPTVNIAYPKSIIEIPYGVYQTRVIFENKQIYKSISNYGLAPTLTNDAIPCFETNIFNFNQNVYNQNITVEIFDMIRKEKKFNSIEELKNQLKKDICSIV